MEDQIKWLFESTTARLERTIRRLWILCIIIFIAFVGSNIYWIHYESQFEDVTVTQEATADGDSEIQLQNINGDYYERESKTNN